MNIWEPIQELRIGELRFLTDGNISFFNQLLPAEAAIEPAIVGGVTIQKNSGASAEAQVSNGKESLLLKFEDGHWWKKGNMASASVIPFPTVHSKGIQFAPTAHRSPIASPEEKQSAAPRTAILLVSGVLVLFALYLVREPIRLFLVGEVERRRVEGVEADETSRLRAIRYRFMECSDRISNQLKEVKESSRRMETKFHEVVGMDLIQAADHPSDRAREIDTMILRSSAFSEAWTAVLNARLPPDLEKTTVDSMRAVEQRVQEGYLTEADEKLLADLEATLVARKKLMVAALDHLSSMDRSLRAERFEENRRSKERSQP